VTFSAVIPPGATYLLTDINGEMVNLGWKELR
jgi:hypothetical protein